jgi:hypothetical protein
MEHFTKQIFVPADRLQRTADTRRTTIAQRRFPQNKSLVVIFHGATN